MSTKYNLLKSVEEGDSQAVEVCCSSRNKELLLQQMQETSADGCTPLLAAAREGHLEITDMLLDAGADVSVKNNAQDTALHIAAFRNQAGICERLIKAGADTEARGEFGNTPLIVACGSGATPAVRLLLRHGVSTQAFNTFRNSALETANNVQIKALIQADRTGGLEARNQMLDQLDQMDKDAADEETKAQVTAKDQEKKLEEAREAARMRWDAEDAEEDRIDEEARLAHEAEMERQRLEEEERLRLEEEERLRIEEEARLAAIAAKKARIAAKKAAKN